MLQVTWSEIVDEVGYTFKIIFYLLSMYQGIDIFDQKTFICTI